MLKHLFVAAALAGFTVTVGAQGTSAPAAPSKGTSASSAPSAASKKYIAPRTPWGDPDLQGNYTNKYEQATPFERPQEFEGKRIEDIQAAELKAILDQRQQRAIERAPFLSGDPTGKIAGPMEFRDIYEIKKSVRPWFVTEPSDGKIPPQTPESRIRQAARPTRGSSFSNGVYDSYENLSLYDRCITRGYPNSMMPAIYGDSFKIIQGQGYVGIMMEMIHETRIIPLGDRPHVSKGVSLDMGDPRGHWEGNTLVVESTNFKERSIYRNANPERMRLIERFTRISPTVIDWSVTVDDPTTWTRPWTFSIPLTMNDEEPIYEYACHEGNYAMSNILNGSRTAEREAAAKK